MLILSQVTRFVSFIFDSISARARSKKNINNYNTLANFFLGIAYLFVGATTGAICAFIAMFRNIVFFKYKNKVPIIILFLYLLIVVLLNIHEVHNFIDVLPILLITIFGTAMYFQNYLGIKVAGIIVSIIEIIYDYHYKLYTGIILCIIYIVLAFISLIKKEKE